VSESSSFSRVASSLRSPTFSSSVVPVVQSCRGLPISRSVGQSCLPQRCPDEAGYPLAVSGTLLPWTQKKIGEAQNPLCPPANHPVLQFNRINSEWHRPCTWVCICIIAMIGIQYRIHGETLEYINIYIYYIYIYIYISATIHFHVSLCANYNIWGFNFVSSAFACCTTSEIRQCTAWSEYLSQVSANITTNWNAASLSILFSWHCHMKFSPHRTVHLVMGLC